MSVYYFIAGVYFLTCIYLGFWLGCAWTDRKWTESTCSHRWEYRSLDGWDHHWSRKCLLCPRNEQLERNQVPYEIRSKSKGYRG